MSDEAIVATIKLCERIIRDKNQQIEELRGNRDLCLGSLRSLLDARDKRIADLLKANNQYLQRARDVEKQAQELEGKIDHLRHSLAITEINLKTERDEVNRLALNAKHASIFLMSCDDLIKKSDAEISHYQDTILVRSSDSPVNGTSAPTNKW